MGQFYSHLLRSLKRRARFSLTTLLIVVAISAVVFAKVGNRVRAVRAATDAVVSAGGQVDIQYQPGWLQQVGVREWTDRVYTVSFQTCMRDHSGCLSYEETTASPWEIPKTELNEFDLIRMLMVPQGPGWHASRAGDDVLRELALIGSDVVMLDLSTPMITDAGAAQLLKFKDLRFIALKDSAVTDRGALLLGELKNLEAVYLSGTAVTDACLEPLRTSSKLRTLDVQRTNVTPDGIRSLKRALPMLNVTPDPDAVEIEE
jgi:hypothetical protein